MTSCRTIRPRLAPMERRMPISRWRAFARASMTFDALAHAATSTRPNAANTGERTTMPVRVMRVGVACAWSCARTVSTRPATRVSNDSIASDPSTCRGVMPRLSRPVTRSRRDWLPATRSSSPPMPYIVRGAHRSRGESSRPTNSGAITPTTTSFRPLASISRPSTAGSRPKSRVQLRSVSTATGSAPRARASSGTRPRPSATRGASASK